MGTKNDPGAYDCYASAEPDEPMFVLLGRDPSASLLVALWATIRERMGEDPVKVQEARDCAVSLRRWAVGKGKSERVINAARIAQGIVDDAYANGDLYR